MKDLQKQIDDLQKQIDQLSGTNSISFDQESALRDRLGLNGASTVITTAKITGGGAGGSMTFVNGQLISYVQAT